MKGGRNAQTQNGGLASSLAGRSTQAHQDSPRRCKEPVRGQDQ